MLDLRCVETDFETMLINYFDFPLTWFDFDGTSKN